MTLQEKLKLENELAVQAGFDKPKRKKQSPLTLGAKHAARVQIDRMVKDAIGNNVLGAICSLLAKDAFKKTTK